MATKPSWFVGYCFSSSSSAFAQSAAFFKEKFGPAWARRSKTAIFKRSAAALYRALAPRCRLGISRTAIGSLCGCAAAYRRRALAWRAIRDFAVGPRP